MEIEIVKGIGRGVTSKSAFDAALFDAGIANYNLILLSSIIPPNSTITVKTKHGFCDDKYGYRLYVVLARMNQIEIGKRASAGIGWVQNGTGQGVFVEHFAEDENDVCEQIKISLGEMIRRRGNIFNISDIKYLTSSILCYEVPVCAIVAAIIKNEGW